MPSVLSRSARARGTHGPWADAPGSGRRFAVWLLAMVALAPPSHGQPGLGPIEMARAEPALETASNTALRWLADGRLRDFAAVHGSEWQLTWDLRSDRPHLIQGRGVPLIPGRGNGLRRDDVGLAAGRSLTVDVVAARAREFLAPWHDLLRIGGMDLRLDPERSGAVHRSGEDAPALWNLEWQQYVDGIPVADARLFVRVNHGNAVQWGTIRIADASLDTEPRIPMNRAKRRALTILRRAVAQDASRPRSGAAARLRAADRGSLEIVVTDPSEAGSGGDYRGMPGLGYDHRLVWRFEYFDSRDHRFLVRVDAHRGEVVQVANLTAFDEATVRADVILRSSEESMVSVPLPFSAVEHVGDPVTDENGVYDYQGGQATVRLDGPFVRIIDSCGQIQLSNSVDGELDLGGSSQSDCATPGFGGDGNTNAARSTYFHLLQARSMALTSFPFLSWLHEPLPANTNLGGSCTAFWNGESVNFSRTTTGCFNLGENPDVTYHEWGHGFDDNTGGNLAVDKGSSEALSDTFAMIAERDGCIGEGFRPDPCPTCGPSCTGVRDVEVVAAGGARTIARPDTIEDPSGIDCGRFACPFYQGGVFPYQGPMGYEGHCESLIASAANWDLIQEMIADSDVETGWQTFTDLWLGSIFGAQSAYRISSGGRCNPQAEIDGCAADNWYTNFLVSDDDDGNLANGTPNACRIYRAFDAHGIACGEPLPCSEDCQPQPFPDAGPQQRICLGESVRIGTEARPGHTYSWSPGGATSAQPFVSPTVTTTYEVAATTACGTFADSTTVFVDDGSSIGMEEEFEAGVEGWQLGGLWHLAEDTPCVDPSATSGSNALYFGLAEACNYDSGSRVDGEAISPPVDGLDESSVLRFDYFLEVEQDSENSYDRLSVAIQALGDTTWQPLWSRDSRDTSTGTWQTSETLSLGAWADQSIRLRFRFDSVDASFNRFRGALIDSVSITAVAACDYPPRVTVASPEDGAQIPNGLPILFSARAFDREDGLLSDGLQWTSDIDGALGTGGEVTTTLSLGAHTIRTSVEDSVGGVGRAELSLEIIDSAPTVTILAPAEGAVLPSGTATDLEATASDPEDGNLSAEISWTSDRDGALGTGAQARVTLTDGPHLLTARVVDSLGQDAEATRAVVVEPPNNDPPVVVILGPEADAILNAGAPIVLSGSASDSEDGDLSTAIAWSSSLDGDLGSGASLTVSLSVGVHLISAAATDLGGAFGKAEILVVVTPDGSPPTVIELDSIAVEDGYLRESAQGAGVGGFANATGSGGRALRLGDASGDRQFRTLLSFDTESIPDTAQILDVRLELRRGRQIGADPFVTMGACTIDVVSGSFGDSRLLEASDFEAAASAVAVAVLPGVGSDGELATARFDAAGRSAVHTGGRTQVRLAFEAATDSNLAYDYTGYWSGEAASAADRPRLIVTYLEDS